MYADVRNAISGDDLTALIKWASILFEWGLLSGSENIKWAAFIFAIQQREGTK
jgi:hypothetical protein